MCVPPTLRKVETTAVSAVNATAEERDVSHDDQSADHKVELRTMPKGKVYRTNISLNPKRVS